MAAAKITSMALQAKPGVNVAIICDADQAVVGRAMTDTDKSTKEGPPV